jgi:hypothetical protein
MKGRLIRPALVVLAVAAALLVVGGIAYANIPDANGVIHGCYKTTQGTLRIVDTDKAQSCSNSETPLDWSQTGPQGPAGPTGPSDVWSVDGYGAGLKSVPVVPASNDLATTPTLPAGSYVVEAETEVNSIGGFYTNYFCDLVDSSNNVYQDTRATSSDWLTIPVQAVVTLASPVTISLSCQASQGSAEAFNWKLSAIKVGTVHS